MTEIVGRTIAVIIAVENYKPGDTESIPSVKYSENNARAFKATLIDDLNIPETNIHSFVNEEATLENIEDQLPKIVSGISSLDTFIFYYSGHAYSSRDENSFTLFDSELDSLKATTAYFDELLLEPLSESECEKAFIFLDSSSAELLKASSLRSAIADICEDEFAKHVDRFPSHACFFSASAGQKTYESAKLNLGIWAWHVTQALTGKMDKAMDRSGAVTTASLKKFLSRAVPIYITKETKIRGTQEPFGIIGSDGNTQIIQFDDEHFDDRADNKVSLNTEDYELRRTEIRRYKDFSGYVKGRNTEPKKHCSSAEDWAVKLTEEDIKQEIEDIYKNAKVVFGFKKRECEKDPAGGFLATPSFRYTVSAFQDKDDFKSIKTTRVLELRLDMGSIPTGLDTVFPKVFEDLYIPVTGSINFDDLAEAFENLEEAGHGELKDEEGRLIFFPNSSKGVSNIVVSNEGIVVNFKASTNSIGTMLGSTQEAFGVISAPIRLLLE